MAARNRKRNNKKKTLMGTSAAQENNATYLLVADELHENTTNLNVGAEAPPVEHNENLMPTKEFKHLQRLEPINEHGDSEDEISRKIESVTNGTGIITEADVQKLLLSYAITSSLTQENNNEEEERRQTTRAPFPFFFSLPGYFQTFFFKCKQVLYNFGLKLIEKLKVLQNNLYEVFWIVVIYVNYWFPNVGDYVRYVNYKFSQRCNCQFY
ncbi:hypothetical protein SMKI_13G2690 [Saccharomyces mikatae IFO 1815]|uniref:Uncharacterized protein n=1 Tax=Saccharomyces mikatae IFO 1815 TaxID=226126 RepID=A0AA35ITR9_SACMI|nr:uncharacterized protein SMKI_13G2690 [Saccharomyces mikatae IFO 1815]CAI4035619.1 hypothetical protein SMKI_13G2690 [Saccharomyces mikatae IFO 1815]